MEVHPHVPEAEPAPANWSVSQMRAPNIETELDLVDLNVQRSAAELAEALANWSQQCVPLPLTGAAFVWGPTTMRKRHVRDVCRVLDRFPYLFTKREVAVGQESKAVWVLCAPTAAEHVQTGLDLTHERISKVIGDQHVGLKSIWRGSAPVDVCQKLDKFVHALPHVDTPKEFSFSAFHIDTPEYFWDVRPSRSPGTMIPMTTGA